MEAEKLEQRYDVRLDWKPFFLRPDTPPEGSPLPDSVKQRIADPDNPLKARAAKLGIVMKHRDPVPSTRRAHEAAEFARAQGKLDPFHAALLRRYWSESQDLYDLNVLRAAAAETGLDPDALEQALVAGTFRGAVEASVEEAQELGISAVPTFLFDRRLAVQGAQELPVFEEAMRRLGATPRDGTGGSRGG